MGVAGQILVVDYENITPRFLNGVFTNGYQFKKAGDNGEASELAGRSDVIILIANERKRECIKLMEHIRNSTDSAINFIVILGGSEDKAFIDRIDDLTFQCFRSNRFDLHEISKAINNAIEMRNLRMKERRFVEDLDRIEIELNKVEHRLYTISNIKEMSMKSTTYLN